MAVEKFDPSTTALVLIDLQHGIVNMPLEPRSGIEVVQTCRSLVETFHERDASVIFVRVALGELRHVIADVQGRDPDAPAPPLQASELVPDSGYRAGDLIITKRQWGAFYGTELEQMLRRKGVSTIVLAGIATNIGVESTARAALDLGFHLVLVEDAMTSLDTEAHTAAVKHAFPRMGLVRTAAWVQEAFTR